MPATFLEDEPTAGVTFLDDEPAPVAAPAKGALERARELGSSPYSDDMGLINESAAEMTSGNEPITPIPLIGQQEGTAKEIGAGIVNAASSVVNALQTPMNLQLAPVAAVPGLGRIIGGLFGADMARHIPEQVEQAIEAPTLQGKVEGFGGTGLTALLAGLGLRHAGKGLPGEIRELRSGLREKLDPILEKPSPAEAAVEQVASEAPQPEIATESIKTDVGTIASSPEEIAGRITEEPATSEVLGTRNEPAPPIAESGVVPEPGRTGVDAAAPEEILSPGPGAASASEPLASYELRKFGERFGETEKIAPQIREETGNRFYEPIPNRVTAEQATKIIDERGVDESIRLLKDEKNDVPYAVRGTIGQTLIKRLNEEYKALSETNPAEATVVLDKTVDLAEWQMEFGTRLGQGVQAFAMWNRLSPEGKLAAFKRTEKRSGKTGDAKVDAEVLRLASEADKAAEGMPKEEAQLKLNKYIAEQTGYAAKDLPIGIYYGNILSGINTQVVNSLDTGLNVLHEVNNLAISNPKAAAQIYAGLSRGLGEGKYDALVALTEGRRITSGKITEVPDLMESARFGEKGGVPIREEGPVSRTLKRASELPIAKPLNAYKYVMRMMSASDSVMFRGAQEARAGLLAYRLAEATEVEKAKLRAEADKILGFDRIPEFLKQAKSEGYSGAKAEARATELMIQSRPEELSLDAADFAGVATYNHAPKGMLGYFANGIGKASEKFPVLKLFVPFTRIVANVTNRGLDNTPWGFKRALAGYGDERLTGEAKQIALTRATAGTAALVGIGALSQSGLITLHGAGPSDPDKKKQLQNAGWRPYSIQVGKDYFTYTYTPVGLGLSALANYMDANRYNELSQKDTLTRTTYSISRIGATVFNQSFLSGMTNLFEILSTSPGKTVSSLKRFFSSTATAATTPSLLRDINGAFDPTLRNSDDIAQDMVRNIPVVRLALKPTLNAYGEPVEISRNRFFSRQKDDPAWQVVVEKNLRLPVADETIFRTPDSAYKYSSTTGKRLKEYVIDHLDDLRQMSDEDAQERLSKAATHIFEDVRSDIKSWGAPVRDRKRRK